LLYLEKHCHHVLEDILKTLLHTIRNSQSHIFLYKAKPHTGFAGNENVLTPLQNTKPATETASQLKQPFALWVLVAIPCFILAG